MSVGMPHDVARATPLDQLVAAELLKIRATRSVWALLVATVLATGVAVAGPISTAHANGIDLDSANGVRHVFTAAGAGSIFVLALAVVHSAGEFRYGLATQTFLSEPSRVAVLGAKAIALTLVAFGFAVLAMLTSLAVALPWMASKHAAVDLGSAMLWRVIAGTILATLLYALIGLGIGMLIRNLAAALVAGIGWFLVAETALLALWPREARYLPGGAASALESSTSAHLLARGWGGLLMLGWAALLLALAALDLRRRDIAGGGA